VTNPTARLTTALAGRYTIEREIGSGGMATVYRAHDVRHDRWVALKVMRPELAALIGAERFLAEIKTTAKLQHPHILPLLDSGEVTEGRSEYGEGSRSVFYAMPYVEGESLRQRIERVKQLPIAEAVRIAIEVAEALDYAHRHGVIHRDIKPANILLHEGRALVADFGIALAVSRSDGAARMTETGMSLGTPHYMSPEQAMGERNLDARTDVYALGCVLYEMLAGEPPFTGATAQIVVAKTLNADPEPITTVRRTVPPNVAAAVMTALQKLPADRFGSAAEFAAALANPAYGTTAAGSARAARSVIRRTSVVAVIGGAAGIAGMALGVLITKALERPAIDQFLAAQFEMPVPDSIIGRGFSAGGETPVFPTRDGRLLWFTPAGLWERSLDTTGARLLLRGAQTRMNIQDISADGSTLLVSQSVGDPGGRGGRGGTHVTLNAISLRGGASRVLVDSADYAAWGGDGYIYYTYFSPQVGKGGLARIRATGGRPDTLASFADSASTVPQNLTMLPEGKGLVMTLGTRTAPSLVAFDLHGRTWHQLGAGGPKVKYVEPGFLLFSSGPSIMAAPFDTRRFAFSQPPLPLVTVDAPNVRFSVNGGTLVYRGAGSGSEAPPLALRSRHGETRQLPNVPSGWFFQSPAVSPDGQRFAVAGEAAAPAGGRGRGGGPPQHNIFVYQLPAGPMTRLGSTDDDNSPSWLPGGREIAFVRGSRDSARVWSIMRRVWDGSGDAKRVYSSGSRLALGGWLPDGRRVVVWTASPVTPTGQGTLGILSLDRPDTITPLVGTTGEVSPVVSRDGRLIAYQSNESGTPQVYVRSLVTGERRQVSLTTGSTPRWAWSGREVFFTSGALLMSAEVRSAGELSVGKLTPVLDGVVGRLVPTPLPGDSLFVAAGEGEAAALSRAPMVVMVNFQKRLAQLFAGARQ
jgi:serine/threonine-protein kinase